MNLNKMGFYIKELRVIGKNKTPAFLRFSEGANVIAGGSDTGKSYAFSCITYALGAENTKGSYRS